MLAKGLLGSHWLLLLSIRCSTKLRFMDGVLKFKAKIWNNKILFCVLMAESVFHWVVICISTLKGWHFWPWDYFTKHFSLLIISCPMKLVWYAGFILHVCPWPSVDAHWTAWFPEHNISLFQNYHFKFDMGIHSLCYCMESYCFWEVKNPVFYSNCRIVMLYTMTYFRSIVRQCSEVNWSLILYIDILYHFSQELKKDVHSWPVRARYGVSFVSS